MILPHFMAPTRGGSAMDDTSSMLAKMDKESETDIAMNNGLRSNPLVMEYKKVF